jgi:hypothetical protein
MILGFKEQFKMPILTGAKIHTIRADEHNRWKAGTSIQMATGVRTKHYHCFKEDVCESTQKFKLFWKDTLLFIYIDDRPITTKEALLLAKRDGFTTLEEFLKWFRYDFNGKIIHWTYFRY